LRFRKPHLSWCFFTDNGKILLQISIYFPTHHAKFNCSVLETWRLWKKFVIQFNADFMSSQYCCKYVSNEQSYEVFSFIPYSYHGRMLQINVTNIIRITLSIMYKYCAWREVSEKIDVIRSELEVRNDLNLTNMNQTWSFLTIFSIET